MSQMRSAIIDAEHHTVKGLNRAGVMDQVTLREFDPLWRPPVEPLEPAAIKRIRESAHVSQAVLARLLNTSLSTVQNGRSDRRSPQELRSSCCTWFRSVAWRSLYDCNSPAILDQATSAGVSL